MRLTVVTALVSENLDSEILGYVRYFRSKNVSPVFIEDFLRGKEVSFVTSCGELVTNIKFKLDPPAIHLLKNPADPTLKS